MGNIKKVLVVGLETRKEHFHKELLERFQREGCEFETAKDYEDAQVKLHEGMFDAMIIEAFLPSSNPAVGKRALELLDAVGIFTAEDSMAATGIVLYDEYASKMKCALSQDNRREREGLPIAAHAIAFSHGQFRSRYRMAWWESGNCGCCAAEGIFRQ